MHRRELPILRACDQRWDDLEGDDRVRRCEACEHEVVNLTSEDEARRALERARTTRVCVRYRAGADGMVMFSPANGAPVASPLFGARPIALGMALLTATPLLLPGAPAEVPPPPVASAPAEPPAPQPVLEALPAPKPARKPVPTRKKSEKPERNDYSMGMLITAF